MEATEAHILIGKYMLDKGYSNLASQNAVE